MSAKCPAMGKGGKCLYRMCMGPKICLREKASTQPYFKRMSKLEPNPGPTPKKGKKK